MAPCHLYALINVRRIGELSRGETDTAAVSVKNSVIPL
jgi:hypothetical protein